jgi:hypothetical protein
MTTDDLPFEQKAVPGKGTGSISKLDFKVGSVIFVDKQSCFVDAGPGGEKKIPLQAFKNMALQIEQNPEMNSKTTKNGIFVAQDLSNAFLQPSENRKKLTLSHMFSFLNHSCAPNATIFSTSDGYGILRALKTISKQEEILICYNQAWLVLPTDLRREDINKLYNFRCECQRCQVEEPQTSSAITEWWKTGRMLFSGEWNVLNIRKLIKLSRSGLENPLYPHWSAIQAQQWLMHAHYTLNEPVKVAACIAFLLEKGMASIPPLHQYPLQMFKKLSQLDGTHLLTRPRRIELSRLQYGWEDVERDCEQKRLCKNQDRIRKSLRMLQTGEFLDLEGWEMTYHGYARDFTVEDDQLRTVRFIKSNKKRGVLRDLKQKFIFVYFHDCDTVQKQVRQFGGEVIFMFHRKIFEEWVYSFTGVVF